MRSRNSNGANSLRTLSPKTRYATVAPLPSDAQLIIIGRTRSYDFCREKRVRRQFAAERLLTAVSRAPPPTYSSSVRSEARTL